MEKHNTHPFQLLLADDDEDDRIFFSEALDDIRVSANLQTVADGSLLMQELNDLAGSLPHLLFLDLNMPYKNGKECLMEIKSSSRLQHIPIIIFSTSDHYKDVEDAYKYGASLYIKKPSAFQTMVKILRKVFEFDWNKHKPKSAYDNFVLRG